MGKKNHTPIPLHKTRLPRAISSACFLLVIPHMENFLSQKHLSANSSQPKVEIGFTSPWRHVATPFQSKTRERKALDTNAHTRGEGRVFAPLESTRVEAQVWRICGTWRCCGGPGGVSWCAALSPHADPAAGRRRRSFRSLSRPLAPARPRSHSPLCWEGIRAASLPTVSTPV